MSEDLPKVHVGIIPGVQVGIRPGFERHKDSSRMENRQEPVHGTPCSISLHEVPEPHTSNRAQGWHRGESVSTGDRNETCRVWSIQRRRLEMLVGKLVPAFLGGDPAYLPTFLGTYRAFGTPQQVLDLLFMRAMASILGTWLHLYPEDFQQSPEFPCLKMLLAYVELNMPDSELEQRARHLLAQLETLKSTEAEGNAPAGEEALETSPDLTPTAPLINPATAPESEQAQSPAPIQVQDLHQLPPQIHSSLTPCPAVTSSDVSVSVVYIRVDTPRHQILGHGLHPGPWLHLYPEDFQQSPEFPCLKMLLAYIELNMPDSDLEQRARHFLAQLETLEPTEAEGHAPAGEEALETSPDLTPSPPLINPATAPQSEQAQSPAPIQVQDLHQLPPHIRSSLTPWPAVTSSDVSVSVVYICVDIPRHQIPGESVSTGDRNETCRVWSIQRRRLETLVGKLVPAFLGGDSAYLPTFLGTYRAFGTPQQVLDLLFTRYGCILPYCDEDGGPLHQLKMAMASILGTWLHLYPEDFQQSPEFPCLKMLLAYVELNMPRSELEQQVRHLLAQLETLEPTEAEVHAPAGEEALETSPDLTPTAPLTPATAPQSEQAQSPAPIQVQDLHQLPPHIRSSLTPCPAVTSSDVSVSVVYIRVDIPRHQIPGESVSTGDRNETCRVWSIQRRRLETLVGKLVPAFLGGDSAYLPTFLGTYRAFGTPQQVLDLLFTRYGCILPYCDEDGGPLHQLKMAMASILGTWLHLYPEDFQQSPEFPCLKMLLAYVELNMPRSELEQQVRHLLAQLETLEPTEAEVHAPAGEEALETSPDLTPTAPLTPATAPQSEQAQSPAPIQVQDLHQLPPHIRSSLTPCPAVTSSDVSVSVVYIRVDIPRHQIPQRLKVIENALCLRFRYGCILPYCDEDGGPLHQLKMAMASILGTWLHLYPEDFQQSPEFPCLKMLLAYIVLNMPGSDLEQRARHLLAQLETLEPTEPEGHAPPGEEALETSPDLTPSPPLINPATAPQSRQAQSPAPIQVQDLHQGESVSTGDRNETCRVWSIQRRRLETLVGTLVPAFLGGDSAYLPTFLGTYRAFGTPQQVLDLLFMRYGCILPYCDEDGGPLHQLKMAMASILGTWLHLYPEDFQQSPEFPCLKMLLAYVELNMPHSELEQQVRHLLVQLETLEPTEAEGHAPAGEEALETSPDLTPSPPLSNPATAPQSEQAQSPAPIQVQDLHQLPPQIRSSLTPWPAVTSSDVSVSVVYIRVDTPRHQIPGESVSTGHRNETCRVWSIQRCRLETLVGKLVPAFLGGDSAYLPTFLGTYRAFGTPSRAMASILGTWLYLYPEDFQQSPEFPCLKMLLAYVELNMPDSNLEQRARHLLAQLETLKSTEAEGNAPKSEQAQSPAPIQVQDLHQLPPQICSSLTPCPAVTSSDVSVSVVYIRVDTPRHQIPGESVSTGDRNETCTVWSIQRRRLETLVGELVPAFLSGDSAYLPTFLGTYRAFGTPQQVLDLLFTRYGCILPYCDEDGGPLHQLKMAMASILGTWLHLYPEDFQQSPEFPCLKMLLAYVELNMPHSELEQQVRHLLAQLETLEPTEAEGHAPAGEEALETSPDLTPTAPLIPATAPQSEQAQSPAPIQVQDLHQAESVSTVDRNETCRVWSIQRRRLETLVGELVPAFLSGDSAYLPTFLGTYRAFSTPQQVLDLLFMRYGCILPYCDEDGGPLHQLKIPASTPDPGTQSTECGDHPAHCLVEPRRGDQLVLSGPSDTQGTAEPLLGKDECQWPEEMQGHGLHPGPWLHLYPEDFQQSPEFPCLKMLLAYIELNMPDSDLEQRARHFLAQLETLEPTEPEGHAPAGEEALETSPDLTPSPPLINPATAPQSEQAQSPAPIQVQDLHQGESVSTGDRNETCTVWSIQRRRLETLVGKLVPAFLSGDSAYLPTFLGTYRAFGTPQQVLDLLFTRAMASILGTWLYLYPEDFQQSPEFPCLKMLLAYVELNMPHSELEQQVRHLLVQLETLEPTEAEGHAPAGEEALETSPDLTPSPPLSNPATAPQSEQAQSPAPIQVQDLHQLPPQIRSSLTPRPTVTSSDVSVSVVYIRVDTPRHQIPGESVSTGERNETCRVWNLQRRRLEMLVGELVPAFLSGDPAYLPTFLGTYRAFGTPQQVLDLLFTRYGCILPYCDEDGGPLHQLKIKDTASGPEAFGVSDHPAPWKSEKQASPGNQRRDVLVLTSSIKRSQSHTESGDKAISSFTYPPVACLNSAGLHRTSLLLGGRVHKPEAPESSPQDCSCSPEPAV
ncbi:hypothetical protein MJT46_019019 [Ovis ammon polii x Ovis aries]|nr:hypothetical protein MJT46_019019 [Ovis ammon polii x Ovis aries]